MFSFNLVRKLLSTGAMLVLIFTTREAVGSPLLNNILINTMGSDVNSAITPLASCTDSNDNFYVTGTFDGTVDFGGGDVVDPNPGTLANSVFIAKYATNGTLVWAKVIGSAKANVTTGDTGRGIAVDGAGNVYVVGAFVGGPVTGQLDFDPGPGVHYLTGPTNNTGAYLVKLDNSGSFQWAAALTTAGSCGALGVCASGTSVYVAGDFRKFTTETGTFTDGTGATTSVPAGTYKNLFVAKLSSGTGALTWIKTALNNGTGSTVYASGDPAANTVAVDGLGNVYVAGQLYGLTFGSNTIDSGGNQTDGLIWKLDSTGATTWVKTFGGTGGNENVRALVIDGTNNLYLTGSFGSVADLDPGSGVSNATAAGNTDIFVSKTSSNGDLQWSYAVGGTAQDQGTHLALDNSGNVYCEGNFVGPVDFDNSNGVDVHNGNGTVFDFYCVKLSAGNGALAWARTLGNSLLETPAGVSILSGDRIKLAATIRGTVDVDPSTNGTLNATSTSTTKAAMAAVTLTSAGYLPFTAVVIISQPTNFTTIPGTNTSFTVTATGDAPLLYQWSRDGQALTGETNQTILLNNVSRTNVGIYSVTVTNLGSSATSSNALLRILIPQTFGTTSASLIDGRLQLQFRDAAGTVATLPYATNFFQMLATTNILKSMTNWDNVNGTLSLTNGWLLFENRDVTNLPYRFYRVREQ